VASTTFSDADCSEDGYGPSYSDIPLGNCASSTTGGQTEQSVCLADGSAVHTFTFDDSSCTNWYSITRRRANNACVGTVSRSTGVTQWSRSSCPAGGATGGPPPAAFPDTETPELALEYGCSNPLCTDNCEARTAYRLGYCQNKPTAGASQTQSLMRYCTSDSWNFGSLEYSGTACEANTARGGYFVRSRGQQSCDGSGGYVSCPTSVAPVASGTVDSSVSAPFLANVQYSALSCSADSFFGVYLYTLDTCLSSSQYTPAGNTVTRTSYNNAGCTGGVVNTETITAEQCVAATIAPALSQQYRAPSASLGGFVLPSAADQPDSSSSSSSTGEVSHSSSSSSTADEESSSSSSSR